MPRTRKAYLSYAPEDAERAAPILRALKDSNLNCWHEAQSAPDGPLSATARRQLAARPIFIRLCSSRAQASSAIQAEAATFRQLQVAERQQNQQNQQSHPRTRVFADIILDTAYQPAPGENADITINAANRPTSAWIAALDQKLGTLRATREVNRRLLTIVVALVVLLAFLFLIYIAFNGSDIFRNRFPI